MPMTRPDDEDKPFVVRWNAFVRVLLVDPSVKLVARTAMDHADNDDGTDVFISNERMARVTGYNEKTIRTAWATMRAFGMAVRTSTGGVTITGVRKADVHDLVIPKLWYLKPILGPHEGRFHCIQCGKVFNPSTSSLELIEDEKTGALVAKWNVYKLTMCPPPREKKGRPGDSCFKTWQERSDRPWSQLGNEGVWKLFEEARGDAW
jgi:hypothetical protein